MVAGLELVVAHTTEMPFLATAAIKHSGVHLGGGVFLTANHFPKPGGGAMARLAWKLDAEQVLGRTTEYEITLPQDVSGWGPYFPGGDYSEGELVVATHDMALHVVEDTYPGGGVAAPMLVFTDPTDAQGPLMNTGYPRAGEGFQYMSEGELPWRSHAIGPGGGVVYKLPGTGLTVADGMSGGPLWLEADPLGEGPGWYLIGLTTRLTSATALNMHYQAIGARLEAEGFSPDAFPTQTLMGAVLMRSVYRDIEGTFFHEHIIGGPNGETITPGGGDDTITGGPGPDRFVFEGNAGTDVITDFAPEDSLVIEGQEVPLDAPGLSGWVVEKGAAGEVIFTKDAENRITVFALE